jgi:hypothetical protein
MQLDKLAPDIGHAAGGMAGLHQWLLRRPWFDVATGHYRRSYDHSRTQFTKNKERKRDPEMHSTKKGNQYYFGSATCKSHGFLFRRSTPDGTDCSTTRSLPRQAWPVTAGSEALGTM